MKPGTYTIQVAATGLETQSRDARVPHPRTPEDFILGKKGQPAYQRGAVKVPFEPLDMLVALTLTPAETAERQANEMADELGLKALKVHEQIKHNNVRLFQFSGKSSKNERDRTLRILTQSEGVALAGPVLEKSEERLSYLTNQLIVKCKPNIIRERAEQIAEEMKMQVVRTVVAVGNGYLFAGPITSDYSLLELAQKLNEHRDVIYAEPNLVETSMLFTVTPTDFLVPQQWHIPLIGLPDAWQTLRDENSVTTAIGGPGDLTFGSENIKIAVYDTGIQSTTTGGVTTPDHPDFQGTVTGGGAKVARLYDFALMVPNNDSIFQDHGMGCAGVAAATANNPSTVHMETEGMAGAAGNCPIVGIVAPFGFPNLRWSDSFLWMSGFNPGWVADGVTYPVGTVFPATLTDGVDVHTSSVRIPDVGLMDDTLDFIATHGRGGRGVVTCVAAGNTPDDISNPFNNTIADHDKIITVAASIDTDVRSGYSCFDPAIDVCAPSNGSPSQGAPGKVTTDFIGGGNLAGSTGGALNYRDDFGGTSSATPLTAGVAALVLSINPDLNWVQVREILRNTAVKIDAANTDPVGAWTTDPMTGNPIFSQWYGYGRIDANSAVIAARDFGTPYDAVIRDNLADTGAVPSTGWHANSPDIWTRRTDDPIPSIAYTVAGPHENPIRGQDNYVFLRVKNTGSQPTHEVYLRALICHFPGFEFRYPDEWQPSVMPSTGVPSPLVPGTYLIGEELVDAIAPGSDVIIKMTWDQTLVPPETVTVGGINVNWHPCLLAEASPHDSGPSAGSHDVKRYNDLAHKNISIDNAVMSGGFNAHGVIAGSSHREGVQSIILDRSLMKSEARILVAIDDDNITERWLQIVESGAAKEAKDLPWRKHRIAKKPVTLPQYQRGDFITLLERSRLSLTLASGRKLIIDGAAGSKLSLGDMLNQKMQPNVSIEKHNGRTVLAFNGGGAPSLELPMPLRSRQYVPVAIAVEHQDDINWGLIRSSQRLSTGEISAGYEIASAR
ncbi:S8 family serine peptidase [Pseudaestuariivita rosea]|uniref:S8 family serine peptidase n=1 Tax=Pseudaestuariivita rosea TaxID=2763263 RepID=UPI001ABA1743|nr:S8 family serine peptidase [Pseudaestuariivita rosea]